jgi:HEAT repeat protein
MSSRLLVALGSFVLASSAVAGEINPKKASGAELVACLQDPSAELRIACAEQIGGRGLDNKAASLLAVVRDDGEPRVRMAALDALVELEVDLMADAAEHMTVHDELTSNRARALAIIEKRCTDASAPAVVQAMADDDATIARKAVIIVGKRGFSAGEPWLVEFGVSHGEPAVAAQAWKTLTRLGNPEYRSAIHRALATGTEAERKAVVQAMRDTVLPMDRAALVGALDDSNSHVARDAAKALVELGDASVAPILREKAAAAAEGSVKSDFDKCADKLEGL